MAEPVWLLVMFDLPVTTKQQRRLATQYRNMLLDFGFSQVQFSVYSKYFVNGTGVRRIIGNLKTNIPDCGEVRAIRITDEQWAGTFRWYGRDEVPMEAKPSQLVLFE
jgi:CRISPR-associated protein Cas2